MEKEILTGIIAASSALCGVALSQALTLLRAYLDRKHVKHQFLHDKLHLLAEELHLSLELLLDSVQPSSDESAKDIQSVTMCARRIYTFSLLYFPLLKPQAKAYFNACVETDRIPKEEAFKDELLAAASVVNKTRDDLDEQIAEFAKVYLGKY
jgi:hypothetical protein